VQLLTVPAAWACEAGLPNPDLVLFLELSSAEAAKRGGYGEERYETQQMQTRVRSLFNDLFAKLPAVNIHRINAGQSIEAVAADVTQAYEDLARSEVLKMSLNKLTFLPG
jgi:dTMP kinase